MFVSKSTYDLERKLSQFWREKWEKEVFCRGDLRKALSKMEVLKDAAEASEARAERSLRSAENALAHKEKCHAEEVAKLKYELNHAQKKISNQKKQIQAFEKQRSEYAELHATIRELEGQIAAASKVTYAVAHHRNDVLAVRRFNSLDDAVSELQGQQDWNNDHPHVTAPPLHIFALIGDTVIADVTDPDKWDETLPVSAKRETQESRNFWGSIAIG